ncbi:hypothetical protein Tco_0344525 [Tanacetum coccineum]
MLKPLPLVLVPTTLLGAFSITARILTSWQRVITTVGRNMLTEMRSKIDWRTRILTKIKAGSSTMVIAVKLPVLNPGEFERTVDGVEQTYPLTTTEEKLARNNELKARGTVGYHISQLGDDS